MSSIAKNCQHSCMCYMQVSAQKLKLPYKNAITLTYFVKIVFTLIFFFYPFSIPQFMRKVAGAFYGQLVPLVCFPVAIKITKHFKEGMFYLHLKYKIQPIMVEKSRQQDLDRFGPLAPTIRRQNPLKVFSQLPLSLLSPVSKSRYSAFSLHLLTSIHSNHRHGQKLPGDSGFYIIVSQQDHHKSLS